MSEVESGVAPDKRSPQSQLINEPVVLRVSVVVLSCPQGVGHSLHAVYNGAREVVGRVHSGELGRGL